MSVLVEAVVTSVRLVLQGSEEFWNVIAVTFEVAIISTIVGVLLGTPMGFLMGATRFRGRRTMIALTNTGMAIPPVVIGLLVMMMLSRKGPLGFLGMLYTVNAMSVAQTFISTPMIAGLTAAAVASIPYKLRLQARSLGASPWQEALLVIKEARLGVVAAVAAGFGAVVRGVGAVMMVGGNIEGKTRVLTTAIVQESRKGEFGTSLAYGIILMTVTFGLNGLITWYQHSSERLGRV
ncbi:MAG: ABC transporter permease [Coriobacteriia bacterium]|jgi:tungstate transport system permease protein|nr:ABC transporter permease [Coriobacteriia bacterium]